MTTSKRSRERQRAEVVHGANSVRRPKDTVRQASRKDSRASHSREEPPFSARYEVASVVVSWNPRVPLPRGWPHPTHVVEVLPGSAVSWIAANGGYENFVANRWGSGHWTLREVAQDAKQLAEINILVPCLPPEPLAAVEPREEAPKTEPEKSSPDALSDEEWARHWAGSFVQDQLRETPGIDIVRVYRVVVNELVENADLVRNQSFDMMIELTTATVQKATRLVSGPSAGSRFGRMSRTLDAR